MRSTQSSLLLPLPFLPSLPPPPPRFEPIRRFAARRGRFWGPAAHRCPYFWGLYCVYQMCLNMYQILVHLVRSPTAHFELRVAWRGMGWEVVVCTQSVHVSTAPHPPACRSREAGVGVPPRQWKRTTSSERRARWPGRGCKPLQLFVWLGIGLLRVFKTPRKRFQFCLH